MQTIIHEYEFDIRKDEQRTAYEALVQKLSGLGLKMFETWGGNSHYKPSLDGVTLTLETAHLFNNQWNTAPIPDVSEKGLRVFDWAQDAPAAFPSHQTYYKRGHWLEQTEEMRDARHNTAGCGYCGKQEPVSAGYKYCPHCLDSAFLKSSELHLTRMMPVDSKGDRKPLTDAEKAERLPLYTDAQTKGTTARGKARLQKLRSDIEKKYLKEKHNAETEHKAFLWMLDNGLGPALVENCIYYNHTGRFAFGWRSPLDTDQTNAVLNVISEFPFPYDVITADGRKLSGD